MDLNAPLGMTPPPQRRRRLRLIGGGVVVACALGGVVLVLAGADPRGGRPSVVALLPPPQPLAPSRLSPLDTTPTGTVSASTEPRSSSPEAVAGARSGSLEGGVMVYRGSGSGLSPPGGSSGPLIIDVTRALDDPLGKSHGTPVAKPAMAVTSPATQARVSIFVSGMGLDTAATRTAVEAMPPAVTFAFVPYGTNIAANVGAARDKGHEILLQLPMRNERGGSPGPHALRPDASAEILNTDLAWLMDRFTGYDGVANLLGAPVTSDVGAMTLVLKAARAHHLFYLDDGTSMQSLASSIASDLGVDVVKADIVLDATADPAVVRANLDRLVAMAKRKGGAVGMASGLPQHLATIARFAAELGDKGVALVPVSTLAHHGEPQAASR